jgi:hypothetical protein
VAKNGGTPNSLQAPSWAPFSIAAGNIQSLNTPRPGVEFGFAAQHHCNFWIGVLEQTILASVATELTSAGIVHSARCLYCVEQYAITI